MKPRPLSPSGSAGVTSVQDVPALVVLRSMPRLAEPAVPEAVTAHGALAETGVKPITTTGLLPAAVPVGAATLVKAAAAGTPDDGREETDNPE